MVAVILLAIVDPHLVVVVLVDVEVRHLELVLVVNSW